MSEFQWTQPSENQPFELQYKGTPILKISNSGQLLAPSPLYSEVPTQEDHEGNILILTQNGQVQRSPYTLKLFGDEINQHLEMVQHEINKSFQDLQQNNEKLINGLVEEANKTITIIQNNCNHRIDALERHTKSFPSSAKKQEKINTLLFISVIVLFFLVCGSFFIASKQK
jgi:hypothetical protein